MLSSVNLLFYTICIFSMIGTIGALIIGWKMLYYTDPWWDWSGGDAQIINSRTWYFTISPIISLIVCSSLWHLAGIGKTGLFAFIGRISIFVVIIIQFLINYNLVSVATSRGIKNSITNYTLNRILVWSSNQRSQENDWYNNRTEGMTSQEANKWKDEFVESRSLYYDLYPTRTMAIFNFQIIASLFTIYLFIHFMFYS